MLLVSKTGTTQVLKREKSSCGDRVLNARRIVLAVWEALETT